jgi:hypothetical protein
LGKITQIVVNGVVITWTANVTDSQDLHALTGEGGLGADAGKRLVPDPGFELGSEICVGFAFVLSVNFYKHVTPS